MLKRLGVHMHEPSPEDTGWDVFSLNYHVSSPVNVVISPTAAKRYLKVSRMSLASYVLHMPCLALFQQVS